MTDTTTTAGSGAAGRAPYDGADVSTYFDPSGLDDGNYPDPNSDTHFIAAVAQTHAYSMPCGKGPDGELLHYVADSGPDPVTSRWDYPEVAGWCETVTTGGSAEVSGVPLAVRGLTAKVEREGKPVHFARVVFTDLDGVQLGRGYTDSNGRVTCDGDPLPSTRAEREQRLAELKRGYVATFPGGGGSDPEQGWQPSSGQGVIDTVDAASVELTAAEIAELPDGYMERALRTLPADKQKLLLSKATTEELTTAARTLWGDSLRADLADDVIRSVTEGIIRVAENAPTLLVLLPAERLAVLIDNLDDTTTAALEETFAKLKEEAVLEQGRKDAQAAREKARQDLINADLPDNTVKARTPNRRVSAYSWEKWARGGRMILVDTIRPNYELADISNVDVDHYVRRGNSFEVAAAGTVTADFTYAYRMSFTRDPRTGWYIRTEDLIKV